MKPLEVKKILNEVINELDLNREIYLNDPEKNFTRNRKLSFKTIIEMIMQIGSGSLSKEVLDWFDYDENTVSVSAFVQQRDKIKPDAFAFIFKTLSNHYDQHLLYKNYRLLAVDGSDLRLPMDKSNSFSFIRNSEDTKGYNLLHLNALYDLLQHIYVDATIQSKKNMNEHQALTKMIDLNYS